MGLLPLQGVDAHRHGQGLTQRVFTVELQVDVPLAADDFFMRIHISLDHVLVDEVSSVAL